MERFIAIDWAVPDSEMTVIVYRYHGFVLIIRYIND